MSILQFGFKVFPSRILKSLRSTDIPHGQGNLYAYRYMYFCGKLVEIIVSCEVSPRFEAVQKTRSCSV